MRAMDEVAVHSLLLVCLLQLLDRSNDAIGSSKPGFDS